MSPVALARLEALLDQLYAVRTEQTAAALGWSPADPEHVIERACREADLLEQLRAMGGP